MTSALNFSEPSKYQSCIIFSIFGPSSKKSGQKKPVIEALFISNWSKLSGLRIDFVMCGSIFAGHLESGGELIEENGQQYKVFYGMSSSNAMNKYSGGVAKYRSAEGKCVKLKYRGPIENTVDNILS